MEPTGISAAPHAYAAPRLCSCNRNLGGRGALRITYLESHTLANPRKYNRARRIEER